MITIRTAGQDDIPAIRDLAERTWWPTYGPILDKTQIEYMLQTIYSAEVMEKVMREGTQTFLLVEEDGIPHGFGSYGIWAENNTWKIHKLYVLTTSQGKGFGRRLIDEINARAKSAGVTTLVLNVNRNNPAFRFYKKYGFNVLREEDIPIGPYWMNDFVLTIPVK